MRLFEEWMQGRGNLSVIRADSSEVEGCQEKMKLLHCADAEAEMFKGLQRNILRVEFYSMKLSTFLCFDEKHSDFI